MTVYDGVLENLSGGRLELKDDGLHTRTFVEIGGKHLRKVTLWNYHDELLVDALGEVVALSLPWRARSRGRARKMVVAIRTPKSGVVKLDLPVLLAGLVKTTFVCWFLAFIVGGIVLGVGVLTSFTPLVVIGVALIACLGFLPLVVTVEMFRARGALNRLPASVTAGAGQAVVTSSSTTAAETKTCPQCAETVKSAALVCRFCSHRFSSS
jgi:uncharacterized protein UPF0547